MESAVQHMCTHTHSTEMLVVNGLNRYDPTHTASISNAFIHDLNKRFVDLCKLIRQAIVDQDCFGLVKQEQVTTYAVSTGGRKDMGLPGPKAFQFMTSQDKVTAFMDWIKEQSDKGILQVRQVKQLGEAANQAWTDKYIEDTYKRGVIRARYEMKKAGFPIPALDKTGGIQASMNLPMHMDRVGLLYTRTFQELKGVTATMDTQLSRILSQGMADGDGPRDMARKLVNTIQGPVGELGITDKLGRFIPAKRRAEIIARTEVIRAHHAATIQEYRNYAVAGVRVQAEFATAGDGRVCPKCASLQGKIYTLDEIEGLIPVHPQCRCIALPTLPEGIKIDNTPIEPETGTVEWKPSKEVKTLFTEQGKEYGKNLIPNKWPTTDPTNTFDKANTHDLAQYQKWVDKLSDNNWTDFEIKTIPIDKLYSHQSFFEKDAVMKMAKDFDLEKFAAGGKGLPRVYQLEDGTFMLTDGNHRVNAAILNGIKEIPVRLKMIIPQTVKDVAKEEVLKTAEKAAVKEVIPMVEPRWVGITKDTTWEEGMLIYRKVFIDGIDASEFSGPVGLARKNFIGKTFDEQIFSKFPDIERAVAAEEYDGIVDIVLKKALKDEAYGEYNQAYKQMRIADSTMKKLKDKLILGGHYNISEDFASTVRHEYAHHLFDKVRIGKSIDRTAFRDLYNRNPGLFSGKISAYAGTNYSEAFAEAFSAYTSPLYGKMGVNGKIQRLPKEIEDLMEKIVGKPIGE